MAEAETLEDLGMDLAHASDLEGLPPSPREHGGAPAREEEAQIFLILSRSGPWWDRYRDTVNKLESSPQLEDRRVYGVETVDGVNLKLRRYRLDKGAVGDKRVVRVLGLGETRDGQILIVDAGGSPEADGIARIDGVLTHSRILESIGAACGSADFVRTELSQYALQNDPDRFLVHDA